MHMTPPLWEKVKSLDQKSLLMKVNEETYEYLWLIHVEVWQRPTQYCKAIIFQFKKNFLKYVKYRK